ncbi:aminotransferase, partial [Streptomyces sp. NPDC056105]
LLLAPHTEAEVPMDVAAQLLGGPQLTAQPARDTTPQLPYLGDDLRRACAQGLTDLDRLTISPLGVDGDPVSIPGAGVPCS